MKKLTRVISTALLTVATNAFAQGAAGPGAAGPGPAAGPAVSVSGAAGPAAPGPVLGTAAGNAAIKNALVASDGGIFAMALPPNSKLFDKLADQIGEGTVLNKPIVGKSGILSGVARSGGRGDDVIEGGPKKPGISDQSGYWLTDADGGIAGGGPGPGGSKRAAKLPGAKLDKAKRTLSIPNFELDTGGGESVKVDLTIKGSQLTMVKSK